MVQTASLCAVASTASADQFLSNLDQPLDPIAQYRLPTSPFSLRKSFTTGAGVVNLQSVTVEQDVFDPGAPAVVAVQVYRTADNVLIGQFPNFAVSSSPSATPELTSLVVYTPDSTVTLLPGVEYSLDFSEPMPPLQTSSIVLTPSPAYSGLAGWSFGASGWAYGGIYIFEEPENFEARLDGVPATLANQPPDISQAHASLSMLWPPNGKMVPLQIEGVTDPEGDAVTLTVVSIMQDEPIANAAKNQFRDAILGVDGRFQLRAERLANGNGRVYTVTFRASDGNVENDVFGTVKVAVPHDTEHPIAVDGGPLYNSLGL